MDRAFEAAPGCGVDRFRGRRRACGGPRWILALLAGVAFGCGGEEGTSERVPTMVPHATLVEAGAEGEGEAVGDPRIEALELTPRRAIVGARVRAKARLAPHPGMPVEVDYRWETGSGRLLVEGAELDASGLDPGLTVVAIATPRSGDRVGETVSHRLRLGGPGQQIGLVVIDARTGRSVGSILRAVVETTDEDAGFGETAVEWRVGGRVVGHDETLDTSPFQPGDVVELRARLDGEGGRPVAAEPVVLERSAPPEIVSKPSPTTPDGAFRYAIQAKSPVPGAALRYELLKGPEGMVVGADSGVVQWKPARGQRGRFEVEVAVMDQWGSGVAQRFSIQAGDASAPPASPR
ncbi:MAG: hypothetical protein R3F35_24485 [Myxococcota bacterium]